MGCVFCNIIAGTEPAATIYEDDQSIAFLDIAPLAPGHTLLVPKEHYSSLAPMPAEYQGALMATASRLAVAVMKAVKADGFNLLVNNGTCAGQVVRHAHIHIIPRFCLDTLVLPPPGGRPPSQEKTRDIMDNIKQRLDGTLS
ncbi:MAG: HIT family protein [Lentisphaeria bacterium]|nr:HIT family protein [Lentisphaeria bacterium]